MPTTDSTEDFRLVGDMDMNFSSILLSNVTSLSVPNAPSCSTVNENWAAYMANTDCNKALSSPVEASPAKPLSTSPAPSDDSVETSPSTSHIASAADSLPCIESSFSQTAQEEATASVSSNSSTPFGDTGETDYPNKLTFKGVTVTLESSKIWNDFHRCGTEMILTKQGRHMFPYCRYRISGLDPVRKYSMVLSVPPADAFKYRWNGKSWEVFGKADHLSQGLIRAFAHHYSPCTGADWMRVLVSFKKLKVTNNGNDQEGHIILHSLHRYIPRLHIIPVPDDIKPTADQPVMMGPESMTFTFPQTEFMAVTTYQNFRITQMKIRYNPFAKGFREDGHNPRLQRISREIRFVNVETAGASATAQKEDHRPKEPPKPKTVILKPIMSPYCKESNAYIHCRGKQALGNLVVVKNQSEEPKKEKNFTVNIPPPMKLCISMNPKAKFRPSSAPKILSKYKKKRHKYKNWAFQQRNSWRKEAASLPAAPSPPPTVAMQPELDDVEGLLFVSFTSKAALNSHIGDRPVKFTKLESSGSHSPSQFSQTKVVESEEEKLIRLEAQLLQNLQLLKHRQTIHPVLQEVGLKLSSLDPLQPIDLQYLGVELPLPPKITSVVTGDMGLSFISRTGKTSDFTKIKGWRNKFVKKDHLAQSDENHYDGSSSKNLSAFCSNMLDEYLESEEHRISERAETLSSLPQGSVAYELPAKSSSYVKTLDSVLKQRAAPPPDNASNFSPKSYKSEPLSPPASPAPSSSPALSEGFTIDHSRPAAPSLSMAQRLSKFLPDVNQAPAPELNPKTVLDSTFKPGYGKGYRSSDFPGLSKPELRLKEMEIGAWNQGLKKTALSQGRLLVALSALMTKCTQLNEMFKVHGYRRPPDLPCEQEFCRLGCVCDSLYGHHKGASRPSFHCQRTECMFECSCFKETITKNLFTAMTNPDACSSSSSLISDSTTKPLTKKLWLKSLPASDEEMLLIPEPAMNLPPEILTKPDSKTDGGKTGGKKVGKTDQPAEPSPPKVTPLVINHIREEDKDLVYKFLERKLTCARVRPYNCQPPLEETLDDLAAATAAAEAAANTASDATPPAAAPKADAAAKAPKTTTNPNNTTKPAANPTEKHKSNIFVLKKKSNLAAPKDVRRPRTLIEIQSTCTWAKEDRKMVLEALCLNMNKNRLCRPFTVGPYYIKPIAKIVMQKTNECVITYKVRISLAATGSGSDSDSEDICVEDEEKEKKKENEAEKKDQEVPERSRVRMTKPHFVVGPTPFLAGIQPAGVLRARPAQSSQRALVQVNGKYYSHARLMMGRMGALHPANRVAAFVTGRLGGTSNLYKKPSSPTHPDSTTAPTTASTPNPTPTSTVPTSASFPAINLTPTPAPTFVLNPTSNPATCPAPAPAPKPAPAPAPRPAPNPAPQSAPRPAAPAVLRRPLVSQMLSSMKNSRANRPPIKAVQPDNLNLLQPEPMPPPPPAPSPPAPEETWISPFQSASPVSITVSPSLKTPDFLSQKGSYSFRICPPDRETCKLPGVSLPGGFTLIQLPKPASSRIPNLNQNNAKNLLSQMVNKALEDQNNQPIVISDSDSDSGSGSDSDFTDEDEEIDVDDEISVDVETVLETEEQIMVDRLRHAAGLGPNPNRRFIPRRYPTQMRTLLDDDTVIERRHEKKCSEQQRRDEQRELFDDLQSILEPNNTATSSKLRLLTLATREIKALTERSTFLEEEKKLLSHIQKGYVQKISLMSGQTEETILEKLHDVCEKQKRKEQMSSKSPYSDLLQSNAAMVQAISPLSLPKNTPLLKPIKQEGEPVRPEPSEEQKKASEQIQATAKNFLQQLLTKLKPIIDNAKISTTSPKPPPEEQPKPKKAQPKPPTLALPLIRSKDGRIILPSNMKPAPQTYYTLTVANSLEKGPTILLKPLDPSAVPQQNTVTPDVDNPTVIVQQPIPPPVQPQQQPDSPQSYVFKSPLASIGHLNRTFGNLSASLLPIPPISPPPPTLADIDLPPNNFITNQTPVNQQTPFPVVNNQQKPFPVVSNQQTSFSFVANLQKSLPVIPSQQKSLPVVANQQKSLQVVSNLQKPMPVVPNQQNPFPVVANPLYKPQPLVSPPVKRGRGRPRKNPIPFRTPERKLAMKEDPDFTPTSPIKRRAEGTPSPQSAPAKRRGRPPKIHTPQMLNPRVQLERCPDPYSDVKKEEEEECFIDMTNVHTNAGRHLTRGSMGKDFPSAKKRSWIDLESELDVDIE
ncbi:hypothetical protein WMY93_015839 [Mugilogobius chulae]|uniref:MAX gene-associated protein n=1 Tax=Mugilogobius chulae TaxID=88201 RepID=A0AAW0NS95_9GOBI